LALWLTHDVQYVFDLGMDGSWVNLGLTLLYVAWVFGCQENGSKHRSVENGSEHRSVCMLCLVCKKMKENNRKGVSAFQLVFCWGKW
jgi:hypothetical protein